MRAKKERKPEYVTALDNSIARNYDVYIMKPLEKIVCFVIAFILGAAVGYLFYGGIGSNEYGKPTTLTYVLNTVICAVTGTIAGGLSIPIRTKAIIKKRRNELRREFRELLDALATSIGSGKSVHDSFICAYDDMNIIYSDDDYIMQELLIIRRGLANNILIEDLLNDFGKRSGIEDISNFAGVFETCTRQGGNMKDIIKAVQSILSDKLSVEEEIETTLSASELEQSIMLIMPIVIIALIKLSDAEMAAKYTSGVGPLATTIGVVCFAVAYMIGRYISKIKV